MQRLEVSGAVRPIYGSLGVKWLIIFWPLSRGYSECIMKHERSNIICMIKISYLQLRSDIKLEQFIEVQKNSLFCLKL